MRKSFLCLIIIIGVAPVLAVNIQTTTTMTNRYVWRGMLINNHMVFQPDMSISESGFTFDIWGNMDLTDHYQNQFNLSEVDYTLSYNWKILETSWSAGIISYTFPHTGADSTAEVFVGITMNRLKYHPFIKIYYDFDEINGLYFQTGASHEFRNGVSVEAHLGYGSRNYVNGYFSPDKRIGATFTDYAISLNYPVKLKIGKLDFRLSYTNLIDSDLHTPGFPNSDGNFIFFAEWSFGF